MVVVNNQLRREKDAKSDSYRQGDKLTREGLAPLPLKWRVNGRVVGTGIHDRLKTGFLWVRIPPRLPMRWCGLEAAYTWVTADESQSLGPP